MLMTSFTVIPPVKTSVPKHTCILRSWHLETRHRNWGGGGTICREPACQGRSQETRVRSLVGEDLQRRA